MPMLTITPQAEQAIEEVLAAPDAPGSYLRLSREPGESKLMVSIVEAPEDGDQVVREDESALCVEATVAEEVADRELDATIVDGEVRFTLGPQAGGTGGDEATVELQAEGPLRAGQAPREF
jgi:Fe-S cluster assembly iron-binding protein IscA